MIKINRKNRPRSRLGNIESLKILACLILLACMGSAVAQDSADDAMRMDKADSVEAFDAGVANIEAPAIIVTPESAAQSESAFQILASSSVVPVQFRCTHKAQVRLISLEFPTGKSLPCHVDYHKLTESDTGPKTIWTASQSVDYCESKVEGMLDRFESWGWDCNEY